MKQPPPWKEVLAGAETNLKDVYSAAFFARRDIAIVDQQFRAFSLCYALLKSRKVHSQSHVVIVGAGFSGMTCAVALAARSDCIIQVFERGDMLLGKFRKAAFRYIHPALNSRGSIDQQTHYDPHARTVFPFLNWSGDYAPLVAEEVARKFDRYRLSTNIALHLKEDVISVGRENGRPMVRLSQNRKVICDIIILATGFGDERRSKFTNDISYWTSGNPEFYRPVGFRVSAGRKETILIAGNGDSGVIELAHYIVRDFDHSNVFSFLPNDDLAPFLGRHYAQAVDRLRYKAIEEGSENFPDVVGPVSWYWELRALKENNPHYRPFFSPSTGVMYEKKVYDTINVWLGGLGVGSAIAASMVGAIENDLEPILSEMASYEIARLVDKYLFKRIFSQNLKNVFQNEFRITVIGRTPRIYSRRQMPQNWFLLRLLGEYGRFTYRKAELTSVRVFRGHVCASLGLGNGKERQYDCDRLIVRQGPDYRCLGWPEYLRKPRKPVAPRLPRSRYVVTSDPVIWWDAPHGKKFRNQLITYFRTRRWQRASDRSVPLRDLNARDAIIGTEMHGLALADNLLLQGYTDGIARFPELYRKCKKRPEQIRKLIKVLLQAAIAKRR